MKGRLSQHGLAGDERFIDFRGNLYGPTMMDVTSVEKRHDESRVSNACHDFENPFLVDRSAGPLTLPAKYIKGFSSLMRMISSASLTKLPFDLPETSALCSTHRANSSGRRMLSVVLIWQKCTTNGAMSTTIPSLVTRVS